MEFWLASLRFPLNPEKVTVASDAKVQVYSILDLGDVSFPRGMTPARVTMECIFPGAPRRGLPIVHAWRPPTELVRQIEAWQRSGQRLRFLVTETAINLDVHVESFEHTVQGGYGDVAFRLALTEARAVVIFTEDEIASGADAATTVAPSGATRPSPSTPNSYTVKPGDSLWAIAKRVYGDGSRWREIYDANARTIGTDPNTITAGQELRIPGGAA